VLVMVQERLAQRAGSSLRDIDGEGRIEAELRDRLIDQRGIVLGEHAAGIAGFVLHRSIELQAEMDGELAGDVVGEGIAINDFGMEGMIACVLLQLIPCRRRSVGHDRRSDGPDLIEFPDTRERLALPRNEGRIDIDVTVNSYTEALSAKLGEPLIEFCSKLAELFVVAIAESEDGVLQFAELWGISKQRLAEGLAGIGSFAVTIGACEDHRVCLLCDIGGSDRREAGDGCDMALCFELFRELLCEALGRAALRGEVHRDVVGSASRQCRKRGCGGCREHTCQQAIEPRSLLGGEGRIVGDVRNGRHAITSARVPEQMARSCSTLCRRVKARKLSPAWRASM
jgi:hypothetical protein